MCEEDAIAVMMTKEVVEDRDIDLEFGGCLMPQRREPCRECDRMRDRVCRLKQSPYAVLRQSRC